MRCCNVFEANNKKIITRSEYSPREAKIRKRGNGVLFHITQGEQITKKYEPRKKNKGKERGEGGRENIERRHVLCVYDHMYSRKE